MLLQFGKIRTLVIVNLKNQLEKIQNKDLWFTCFKFNISTTPPHTGFKNIFKMFNLESLKTYRNIILSIFLFKLIINKINDSFLHNQIHFKIDTHNFCNLFYIPHHSQSYMLMTPLIFGCLLEAINFLITYSNVYIAIGT